MTAPIVLKFIEEVWNQQAIHLTESYLHPDFIDHSLPDTFPAGAEGVKKWIRVTSASFAHHTIVEDQVTEGDKSIIKITMRMKHIGTWRGIPATGKEVSTKGYRFFRLKDGKIIEQWAMIDGNLLEKQLTKTED
ncbi:ester cyclase [Chitinophaga sp. MM2321]|uniref:ester cyclase n=1 Tax=Chitinophaga sp. MM2321 TaxID=3137178 RepID=UPI0032D5709A